MFKKGFAILDNYFFFVEYCLIRNVNSVNLLATKLAPMPICYTRIEILILIPIKKGERRAFAVKHYLSLFIRVYKLRNKCDQINCVFSLHNLFGCPINAAIEKNELKLDLVETDSEIKKMFISSLFVFTFFFSFDIYVHPTNSLYFESNLIKQRTSSFTKYVKHRRRRWRSIVCCKQSLLTQYKFSKQQE